MIPMTIEDKINEVKAILKDKKVAIAFSGGADSTLISYLAGKVSKNPIAITINNNIMPEDFIENTRKIAGEFKITQEIIDIDFLKNEKIMSNVPERCYLCRKAMYEEIVKIASENNCDFIADGTNITDLVADRPGILINYENNIRSPFVEARLTSAEIHEYLNDNNIYFSKSTTCMATRLPFNCEFTKKDLLKLNQAERYIKEITGCEIVKVRKNKMGHVCEVDDLEKISDSEILNKINDKLNDNKRGKVYLNLSTIEDNHEIKLDYEEGKFSYKLDYNINLEKTEKEIEKSDLKTGLKINKNGVISGENFKNYDEALNEFEKILPLIRREL